MPPNKHQFASMRAQLAEAAKVSRAWDVANARTGAVTGTTSVTNKVWQRRTETSVARTGAYGDYEDIMAVKDEMMGHVVAAYRLIEKTGACHVGLGEENAGEFVSPSCNGFAFALSDEEFEACMALAASLKLIVNANIRQGEHTRAPAGTSTLRV